MVSSKVCLTGLNSYALGLIFLEVIAIVTQLHGQRLACPCTRELFKNCQELFPSRCTMFSIAQIYTGMMKTSPGSTLYGAAGKAIWEFLDWDIKYSNNSDIRNAALIANKLQSKVSVRTDGTVIEYGWRYDLPEKSGTLVDFREVNDSWLIQILYEDFPPPGLRLGDLTDLLQCLM